MAQQIQLKFNDPAPDVNLLSADGKPIQLSSLWQNKVLVLAFTRHFGCRQCKEMVDQLIDAPHGRAHSTSILLRRHRRSSAR